MIDRDNIPEQMTDREKDSSRRVPFIYDPTGKSYAIQYNSDIN